MANDLRETLAGAIDPLALGLRVPSHWRFELTNRDFAFLKADAAIAAYEAHRPRPVVTLTKQEWEEALDEAYDYFTNADRNRLTQLKILAGAIWTACPWLKVEGE